MGSTAPNLNTFGITHLQGKESIDNTDASEHLRLKLRLKHTEENKITLSKDCLYG